MTMEQIEEGAHKRRENHYAALAKQKGAQAKV
jgi:hypothetical protein